MHFLHRELERNEALGSIVYGLSEETAQNESKIGLILDLNPFWHLAVRLYHAGLDPDIALHRSSFPPFFPLHSFWSSSLANLIGPDGGEQLPALHHRFDFVQDMIESLRKRWIDPDFQPLLLRIIVRPNSDLEALETLRSVARAVPIMTVVQTQGLPRLVVAPGSRVTPSPSTGSYGTLGGYLRNQKNSTIFAVTCGHVMSTASAALDPSGQPIGNPTHVKSPVLLPSGTVCHANCGSVTELDVALIDTNVPATNKASSIANIVGNGQIVEMNGATSGLKKYEIGGAVVDYDIAGACWKNLIQIHVPLAGILPGFIQFARTKPPQPGDSGAWIIRNNTEWVGMVVASSELFGFALSASDIVRRCDSGFLTSLALA